MSRREPTLSMQPPPLPPVESAQAPNGDAPLVGSGPVLEANPSTTATATAERGAPWVLTPEPRIAPPSVPARKGSASLFFLAAIVAGAVSIAGLAIYLRAQVQDAPATRTVAAVEATVVEAVRSPVTPAGSRLPAPSPVTTETAALPPSPPAATAPADTPAIPEPVAPAAALSRAADAPSPYPDNPQPPISAPPPSAAAVPPTVPKPAIINAPTSPVAKPAAVADRPRVEPQRVPSGRVETSALPPPTPSSAAPPRQATGANPPPSRAEAAPRPLRPASADSRDPVQMRAVAAGLHPQLPRDLLARLTPTDYRNAGIAIQTAVAEAADGEVFVWPRQRFPELASFVVRIVPATHPECRRYVVTVNKDGWSTTAPPMENCEAMPGPPLRD
jgi:hypothetical protein